MGLIVRGIRRGAAALRRRGGWGLLHIMNRYGKDMWASRGEGGALRRRGWVVICVLCVCAWCTGV